MKFDQILHVLNKQFELKKNHILIINLLYNSDELTADEIVSETKIPKGGIYEFLNDLINLNLISKNEGSPAKYNAHNFENRVVEFIYKKFNDFVQKETELLNLINTSATPDIQIIKSKEEYTFQMMDIISRSDKINFIVRSKSVPFELYPEKDKEFIEIRNIMWKKRPTLSGAENPNLTIMHLKTFKDAWEKKKQLRYLITKEGFDYYFETLKKDYKEKKPEDMVKEILKRLHKTKIDIKVVDEKIPYNLFLSEKKMMFVVAHSTKIITGFVSTNKDIIEVYQNLFDSMFHGTKPVLTIEEYLKKVV